MSCPRRVHNTAHLPKYAEGLCTHMYFQSEELPLPIPSCVLTQVGSPEGRLLSDLFHNAFVLAQATRTPLP